MATDNTTYSDCLYQQGGGVKSGPLCALLWRILTWCTRRQVTLKARHILGRLNVIEDKLSTLGQTIQAEWSGHPRGLPSHLFPVAPAQSGSVCHQLPQFISPVPDPRAWAVDALRFSWEGAGSIFFPTSSHLGQSGREVAGLPMQQNN